MPAVDTRSLFRLLGFRADRGAQRLADESRYIRRRRGREGWIGVEDTRIDWRDSATTICNLVRGQSDPFVNAWTTHRGLRLWVKAATRPTRAHGGTPGRIVKADYGGVVVASGGPGDGDDRGVVLLQVSTETGPPVRALDYFTTFGEYLH